jgi:hypothetical protein
MWQLNLPVFDFNIKNRSDKLWILDNQRKKFVRLTPEEWVRQHFIQYLIHYLQYPPALVAIEQEIKVSSMKRRCDAVIYNQYAEPLIIAEFKSPSVPLTQKTFDQIFTYNSTLQVRNFFISNGMEHYFCHINSQNQLKIDTEIPLFQYFQDQK